MNPALTSASFYRRNLRTRLPLRFGPTRSTRLSCCKSAPQTTPGPATPSGSTPISTAMTALAWRTLDRLEVAV